MKFKFDIIIIGSGPAGVSAAFPLVRSNLKVLMVDGGQEASNAAPQAPYFQSRTNDKQQTKWMIGNDFYALRANKLGSPKLRAPIHEFVFRDFQTFNRIESQNFMAIGSLAKGGLSNAWGCGVARLSPKECKDFPFDYEELLDSYQTVSRRIGISGAIHDDLSEYFGLDHYAQKPIEMDQLQQLLYQKYLLKQSHFLKERFLLGRTRLAVLTQDQTGRQACDLMSNCLWGCQSRALYNATYDIEQLKKYPNFYYQQGFIVEKLQRENTYWNIEGITFPLKKKERLSSQKIILAAGTLATTSIVMRSLKITTPLPLRSSPTANFLLWIPRRLGTPHQFSSGSGQLSFVSKTNDLIEFFGSIFSTNGIPVSEFLRHVPFRRRFGIVILKQLLTSCAIGNVYLPNHFSSTTLRLKSEGTVLITGGYQEEVEYHMQSIRKKLGRAFLQLGAILIPKSFQVALPGSDLHYVGTLPMMLNPRRGEANYLGEIHGLEGVHVVDGACLPMFSEKFHTLTIMANADRIGKFIASNTKDH